MLQLAAPHVSASDCWRLAGCPPLGPAQQQAGEGRSEKTSKGSETEHHARYQYNADDTLARYIPFEDFSVMDCSPVPFLS